MVHCMTSIHNGHTLTRSMLALIQSLSSTFPNDEIPFLLPPRPSPLDRLRFLEGGGRNSWPPLLLVLKDIGDPFLRLTPPPDLRISKPSPALIFDFFISPEESLAGLATADNASDVVKEGDRKTKPPFKVGRGFDPPPTATFWLVSRQVEEQEDEANVKGRIDGKTVNVNAEPSSPST